ncbi:MAG: right-handed parallel beta-helix repeat-containing protein, partial [Limisphaerales bacterium]
MRPFLLAGLITLGTATPLSPTTYYVSHTGSNTPPYTSWATAADSIGTVFALALPYDTVRVGTGAYTDSNLVLRQGMVFLGSGMDSTVLQMTQTANPDSAPFILVECKGDSQKIEGFHLRADYPRGIGENLILVRDTSHIFVSFNKLTDAAAGIEMLAGLTPYPTDATEITNNVFSNCYAAIDILGRSPLIQGNIISDVDYRAISCAASAGKIIGNICLPSPSVFSAQVIIGSTSYKEVLNNVVLGSGDYGIIANGNVRLENNTVAYNDFNGITLNFAGGDSVLAQNNISIRNKEVGLGSGDTTKPSYLSVRYNDLWKNRRSPFNNPINWDSIDFEGKLSQD